MKHLSTHPVGGQAVAAETGSQILPGEGQVTLGIRPKNQQDGRPFL
jgi:hypothetical protein